MTSTLATVVLALALAFEVRFIARDLGARAAEPAPGRPVAQLTVRVGDIKIRRRGSLLFDDALAGTTLRRGDTLHTLDGAVATLSFFDGTTIVAEDDTLLSLGKDPDDETFEYRSLRVELVRGTIHKREARQASELPRRDSRATPAFELRLSGGNAADVSSGTEFSARSGVKETRLLVREGAMRLWNGARETRLGRGEEAIIPDDPSALPLSRRAILVPLSPRAGESIAEREVRFRWLADRNRDPAAALILEASRDSRFRSGVLHARIPPTQPPIEAVEKRLTLPRGRGLWYWRIRLEGASGIESPLERFRAEPPVTPEPLFPEPGAKLAGESAEFSWRPVEGASGYELAIDERAIDTVEPWSQVHGISEGISRWRVRARLKDGRATEWSPTQTVERK